MKHLIKRAILSLFVAGAIFSTANGATVSAPGRQRVNINREWKFLIGDHLGAEQVDFNDADWTATHIPHSFSIPYFMYTDVYYGYGWYRKVIKVGEEWKNKRIGIEFEGSFIDTEVFCNGQRVGEHVGGYTSFYFDLTPYLHQGENILAVRVNNLWNARVAPRSGDHQFSGGIYRDVWLNVTDHLRMAEDGTYVYATNVTRAKADLNIEMEVRNDFDTQKTAYATTVIYDPQGQVVSTTTSARMIMPSGKSRIFKQKLPQVKNPMLWSPETPHRYKAVTTLTIDGTEVDSYTTRFGIRDMVWTSDKGFFLNGSHYYLLGANVHQDQAGWGDAVTNGAATRDVQMMKDCGFNCIRGSHYPHDPNFAQACDSIGLILFMETMNWGTGGHGDEGGWGNGGIASSYPTIPADQPYYEKSVLTQLKEEIRTHRNSPSIACWSLCNEPFFCSTSVDDKMKHLLNLETDSARKWDPYREVAIGGAQRKDIDKLGKGAIAFYNGDGASRWENQDPGVPNLVSEYGYPDGDRPRDFNPVWNDLGDGYTHPAWRSGQIVWCGFDHGTVMGYGLAKTGLVDYFRIPKRNYYWYVEAYKKGNRNPVEPSWPKAGVAKQLKLSASQTTINSIDGTDDAQIFVRICNARGEQLSNVQPVTLKILSGPGEFPTGHTITFTPPTTSNWKEIPADERSDIRILDGIAAISMRSYYAGETVIEATSNGLKSDTITITSVGEYKWVEGVNVPCEERPYSRYNPGNISVLESTMTLAEQRPTWSSSDRNANYSKGNANDGDETTMWRPLASDNERWWLVHLEAQYSLNRIELTFPNEAKYQYIIEVAKTTDQWTTVVDQSDTQLTEKKRVAVGKFGDDISYVRIRFTGTLAALAEVKVGGSRKATPLDDTFLSGTIIGTVGSWGNDAAATKTAAMDFSGGTYFDGPEGVSQYWIGLDLGRGTKASITSMQYMPRYNNDSDNYAQRMVGGKLQVSDDINFTNPTTVGTISEKPAYKEFSTLKSNNTTVSGRYVRYLAPQSSYGNVAELQFYGNAVSTGIREVSDNNGVSVISVDKRIQIVGASVSDSVSVFNSAGQLVYKGYSHDIIVPQYGVYVVQVGPWVSKLAIKKA